MLMNFAMDLQPDALKTLKIKKKLSHIFVTRLKSKLSLAIVDEKQRGV